MPLLTKDAFISSQDGKNDPTDSCNKSQTATTHLLIILFRFALISTFFSSLLLMDLSCQAKEKIHSIFQVQWSSGNYSFWKRCEHFQTSHSSLSVCLRVACEVVCCKESPFSSSPFLFKQLAQPTLPAPVASTFNTNWSLVYDCQIFGMYIYVRGKECPPFFLFKISF